MGLYQQLREKGLIDQYGLVSLVSQKDWTDNGALFTTQAIKLIEKYEPESRERNIDLFNLYISLDDLIDEKGLTHRRPKDNSQDSPDNIIALCSTDAPVALKIYNYGRTTFPRFIYNTPNPGKFTTESWMGRQVGLIGYMQIKSNSFINPFRYLVLCGGLWLTSRKETESTSDRLLAQLIIDSLPKRWYTNNLINWWNNKIKQQYPGGINDVVKRYFGPDHPFSEIWV